MTRYQQPRDTRYESRTPVDKIKAGILYPCMAIPVRPSEGGVVRQEVTFELDPIMGRMLTPIFAEVTNVFVPVETMDALLDPAAQYAGMSEVVRQKLLSGNPLFGLEAESVISRRCGVNPQMVGASARVCSITRLAYIAAVNHLRQRKYVNATLLPHTATNVSPAILSETILERLNGVLDPDPKINGQVQLEIPNLNLPVDGVGFAAANPVIGDLSVRTRSSDPTPTTRRVATSDNAGGRQVAVEVVGSVGDNTLRPNVFARLNGVMAGGLSLNDLHVAERTDRITREIRQIIDENPEYGEEYAIRYAHGLSLDKEGIPYVLGHRRESFNPMVRPATDMVGVADDVMRSDMVMRMSMSVMVPRTELGGMIVTLVSIKPDEVLKSQPHPILSEPWGLDNHVADELELDPKAVTMRQLDSAASSANQGTTAFYTGYNALKKAYVSYGLTRNVNPETVENKTRVWQYEMPMSVTPDNILYPTNLSQYPWADQVNEICTVVCATSAAIATPMVFGPTPVEDLATVVDEEIFGDDE